MLICIGTDDTVLPTDTDWMTEHVHDYHRRYDRVNLCSLVQSTISATLEAVTVCKMKEVTKAEVKLMSRVLKTAVVMALQLFRYKEMLSTDETKRNYGGIKFHALSHHFAEQILMFGTCVFTDTDQFERQHNVDGVLAYSRTSKRGHSMSKEMLVRSMTNNFFRILRPRADAETLNVLRTTRSQDEYEKLKQFITTGATVNSNSESVIKDGFRVISNYKSVPVWYNRSNQELVIETPIFHELLTAEKIQYAFESYIDESNDESLQFSLRKLQKGTTFT
jgi:hypothetical protein